MSLLASTTQTQFRGATLQFSTTFFDVNGNIVQPAGAVINLVFFSADDSSQQTLALNMIPPTPPATAWTVLWDTRNVGQGVVSCSVHSVSASPPYSVEDFQVNLSANPANLLTF